MWTRDQAKKVTRYYHDIRTHVKSLFADLNN